MFKPKKSQGKIIFDFKPISDSGEDSVTGIKDKKFTDVSLFIDSASSYAVSAATLPSDGPPQPGSLSDAVFRAQLNAMDNVFVQSF